MERTIDSAKLERSLFPYQVETRRPIVSLAFVVPLLLIYELGILLLGNEAIRNGLDEMLRFHMYQLGIGEMLILPVLTVAILLCLHHKHKDRWNIRPLVLLGMIVESIFLGLILLWAAKAQKVFFDGSQVSVLFLGHADIYSIQWWSSTIAFLGAGIYEELVFRLMILLPFIWLGTKMLKMKTSVTIAAVVITSVLFALLHYQVINPSGLPFDWSSFAIRFVASVFFCTVFLTRGFGVAVGTHAAYDVLTLF